MNWPLPERPVGYQPRTHRRLLAKAGKRAAALPDWPPWVRHEFTPPSTRGWLAQIREAYANQIYAVLVRRLPTGVVHLAITPALAEPPWRDLQRIKNELIGPEFTAVQVCPRESRLIDAADMYHLWALPAGAELGFGLGEGDEP